MTEPNPLESDFSLVLGGPIFQIYRKAHLSGTALELLQRRMAVITLIAWLPLLGLTLARYAGGGISPLSFFRDVEAHVRFLIALPVLIAAEVIVHRRLRLVVRNFVVREIVRPEDVPAYDRALASAIRLRNSVPLEVGLMIAVYTFGLVLWSYRAPPGYPTWYSVSGDRWRLTPAGFWYVFVSIPLFQIILLRWYLRLLIWFRFLWYVSRLNLHVVPTHPDRCGGLGFLGRAAYTFGPILFAEGALLSGLIATSVLYGGETLMSYKVEAVGFVALFLFFLLGPLLMFTPALLRNKRKGLADYGLFGERYVQGFEQKWILQAAPTGPLLGSPDIQSLADLGNSYGLVRQMRVFPFGAQDIVNLAWVTALPLLPLLLTVFSVDELIKRVFKVLF